MISEDMPMAPVRAITDNCIILFVKSPELVPVKSRLAESIGEEIARQLFRNFVLDLLETLSAITAKGRFTLKVCFYPPEAVRDMRKWLGDDYIYMPQEGKDLGERMENAFLRTFDEGYRRVLLLGSDAPDLTREIIIEGFRYLDHHGAVIGPAHDGGYFLIGFRASSFLPAVFEGILWSSGEVFADTMAILRHLKCDVYILPPWRDIDTLADLQHLRERHRQSSFANSRTMHYLLSLE